MINQLLLNAIEYDRGDPKRIQHLIKVYELSRLIGVREGLDEITLKGLLAAAVLHDIGIHEGERLYGRNDGEIQQKLGPGVAAEILAKTNGFEDVQDRVLQLIATHHTYNNIDGIDLQILIEADLIVNHYEDGLSKKAISASRRLFKTKTGKWLIDMIYGLENSDD